MRLFLPKDEVFVMDGDVRGLSVICQDGSIWLTQPKDEQDHLLELGRQFVISRPGRIVLVALSDSDLELPDLRPCIHKSMGGFALARKLAMHAACYLFGQSGRGRPVFTQLMRQGWNGISCNLSGGCCAC